MNWHMKHQESLGLGDRISDSAANGAGSFQAFIGAVFLVLIWAITGPFFGYSTTWQLVINTGTTIVTFWLGFLILNNNKRQAERDRHQAEEDYKTNMESERRIENLQKELARIEIEKLDLILKKLKHGK